MKFEAIVRVRLVEQLEDYVGEVEEPQDADGTIGDDQSYLERLDGFLCTNVIDKRDDRDCHHLHKLVDRGKNHEDPQATIYRPLDLIEIILLYDKGVGVP